MNPLQGFQAEIKMFLIVLVVSIVISVGGILLLKTTQPPAPSAQPASVAQSISITSPSGIEQWPVGSTQTITWDSTGIEKVRISPAVGGKGLATSEEIDASLGRYELTVPDASGFGVLPPYEVFIMILDEENPDVSDKAGFTAIGPDSTLSEFEDWQAYRNDEFGFEVRYPREGILTTEGERVKVDLVNIDNGNLSIGTPSIESEECRIYYSYLSPTPYEFSELVSINGVEFLKYNVAELSRSNSISDHGNFITLQSNYCIDIAFMNMYPSPAEYEQEKELRGGVFDQILSTFRFVE